MTGATDNKVTTASNGRSPSILEKLQTDPVFIGIILIVAITVYIRAIFDGFVIDDKIQVVGSTLIRDFRNLPKIFSEGIISFKSWPPVSNNYRPMMNVIYMFDYYIFGLKPWGYHLTNILFHAGVSVLVYLTIKKLLGGSGAKSASLLAFVAALLFATHPINTETVIWVASIPELSYTFFFLLTFYLYMTAEDGNNPAYFLSFVTFALATLCKETALTLPFILVAYDYAYKKEGYLFLARTKRYVPYLIVLLGYFIIRYFALGGFAPRKANVDLSGFAYFINIFPLFSQYLGKLLLPINLTAIYSLHPIFSILEPKGWISIIVTIAFLVATGIAIKKRSPILVGLLLIALPITPVLVFYRSIGIFAFAERYLYLPSIGFVFLVAYFLSHTPVTDKIAKSAGPIAIFFILALYSYGTITRIPVWKNEYTLYSDTVKKSPDLYYAHSSLGLILAKQGRTQEAIRELQTAIRLKPDYAEAHYNLGLIYMGLGKSREATFEFIQALKIDPNYSPARQMLSLFQNR